MLNSDLKIKLINLAQISNPTEERLNKLFIGWENYFSLLSIPEDKQMEKFNNIISIRMSNRDGMTLSISAPISSSVLNSIL